MLSDYAYEWEFSQGFNDYENAIYDPPVETLRAAAYDQGWHSAEIKWDNIYGRES